jgi:hypothetical protein
MPSFKYGARQFQIQGQFFPASTAVSVMLGAWQYLPAVAAIGTIDAAAEGIKSATLTFATSVAQANSTAAGGSVIIAASQYNSAGATVATAALYNQAAGSQAGLVPIDVTALLPWTFSAGDIVRLGAMTNTVGIPAAFSACVLSATIDTVTAA